MIDDTGVSAPSESTAVQAADSPPASPSSGAPNEQSLATSSAPVQGQEQQSAQNDPLTGVPSADELKVLVEQKVPHAEALARLRGAYEPLKTEFSEFKSKVEPFQPFIERFENPAQLESTLGLYDSLIGWERDPSSGQLIPATETGAQRLAQEFPLHADFLAADLLNGETVDPSTGRRMTRMDVALEGIAKDPTRRASALKILGAVEPSSISPQWQPTPEELENVPPELQDVYKKLPYEERQELKLASPDYIKSQLQKEKVFQELQAEREASQQREQAQIQAREQYIAHQASQAGEQHLQALLSDKLTTFHNSVVEKCNFIQPIDPQSPPQGMTADQVQTMNAQIDQSNKAEAAQITAMVVALQNEQTRAFVLPLLQQIGVIDEKFLREMDAAASGLGSNARNYGELTYRGKLQSNGNGYQPDASVTGLGNAANQNLNRLIHYANQVAGRLIEKRSQFFALKAQDHNSTLNSAVGVRPSVQGSAYDPSSATPQLQRDPQNPWPTRREIEQQYS